MKPFLPPAVPFGSKQWPTLITPGPGPGSLDDLALTTACDHGGSTRSRRSMNLNTIAEVKRPDVIRRDRAMARRPCLAGRRHLAVLRAAGRHRHADRSRALSAGRR